MSDLSKDISLPYRGPEEFRFVDREIFSQREQEVWEILQLITLYRGIIVYGQSGNGKSSLVNAGLIPELVRQGYAVDRVRVQHSPLGEYLVERISLRDQGTAPFLESGLIQATSVEKSKVLTVADFAAALNDSSAQKRCFLIFDQFEEIVTRFEEAPGTMGEESTATRARILAQLELVLHSDSLPVKLLFVFREDYLAPVRSLLSRCPEIFRQYYWLRAPSTDKTLAIIERPLRLARYQGKFDRRLTQELAAQLNSRARKNAVNLTDLQIACLELWQAAEPGKLLEQRKVDGLIQDYLTRALEPLKKSGLHEPAIALLGTMVTPHGTRNVISEYDAITRVAPVFLVSENLLREALNELLKTRLVRKSVESEEIYYEITSEFLSAWINQNRLRQEARIQRDRTEREVRNRLRAAYVLQMLSAGVLLFLGLYLYTHTAARSNEQRQQELLQAAQGKISLLQQQKEEADRALRVLSSRTSILKKGGGTVFGSDTLEVVIGVAFLILLLGLVCSTLNELVALLSHSRSRTLRHGLQSLLRDVFLTERLYHHPLIKALTQEGKLPTYIPSRAFAMALLDIVAPSRVSRLERSEEYILQTLSSDVFTLPDGDLKRSLSLMVSQSRSLGELYRNIETWFNDVMDAVSGFYKRRMQIQLLSLALLLAIAVNVDTLAVITTLSKGSAARAAVTAAAVDYAQNLGPAASSSEKSSTQRLSVKADSVANELFNLEKNLQLPITWSGGTPATRLPIDLRAWFERILGWLITALAVALCAGFWFDFLNRFMIVRSTVKPEEKRYQSLIGSD